MILAPVLLAVALVSGSVAALATRLTTPGWTATQMPTPTGSKVSGAGYAGPMACPAAGSCVVLGQTETPSGVNEDLVSTEASGKWSSVVAPLPTGGRQAANLGPDALACHSVGNCVGTSVYAAASSLAADILVESAGKWSAARMPLPAGADTSGRYWPQISRVGCPATGECVIVGSYETSAGLSEGLIVSQVGSGFVAAEAPTPGGVTANHGAHLTSVSCYRAGACFAVGSYVTSAVSTEPFVVSVQSSGAAAVVASLPPNAAPDPRAQLVAVSCGGVSYCVATGAYEDAAGDQFGVLETWSAGRWTPAEAPLPAGAASPNAGVTVDAVRCVGVVCVAVGEYGIAGRRHGGLVLVNQSGTWVPEEAPTTGSPPSFTSVSCSAASVCVAAASYTAKGGAVEGYLLSVTRSALSWQQAPLPTDANTQPLVSLDSVTCPATGACAVSGDYVKTGVETVQLGMLLAQ